MTLQYNSNARKPNIFSLLRVGGMGGGGGDAQQSTLLTVFAFAFTGMVGFVLQLCERGIVSISRFACFEVEHLRFLVNSCSFARWLNSFTELRLVQQLCRCTPDKWPSLHLILAICHRL